MTAVQVVVPIVRPPLAQEIAVAIEGQAAVVPVTGAVRLVADRAQGAEARRGRAALEVVPAWDLVVVDLAVAAEGGGRKTMQEEIEMNFKTSCARVIKTFVALTLTCAFTVFYAGFSLAQEQPRASASQQQTFKSPDEAAAALIRAAESNDVAALMRIFGSAGKDLISTEDAVQDKNIATEFAEEAHQKQSIAIDPKNPNRAILVVGNRNWPMPIPLAKRNGAWLFDTKAGRQEMLYRRIGANELDALQICRAYDDAQFEYALTKHDGSEVNQYAQRILSTPGKQDGLAWRNPDGSLGGPIAEGVAKAIEQGYIDKMKPYHGYYFKVLKGQGPAAPLGTMNFVIEGAMIGGFALAAAPADYRVTGVKTFIVGYQGVVYQKDLGPDTLKVFKEMELYNPDTTWKRTDDSWPYDDLEDWSKAKDYGSPVAMSVGFLGWRKRQVEPKR
jgi:hypothetical protein